jgi:hypothetical protein
MLSLIKPPFSDYASSFNAILCCLNRINILKFHFCVVIYLLRQYLCSISLVKYLIRQIAINPHYPAGHQSLLIFSTLAWRTPLSSMISLTGQILASLICLEGKADAPFDQTAEKT